MRKVSSKKARAGGRAASATAVPSVATRNYNYGRASKETVVEGFKRIRETYKAITGGSKLPVRDKHRAILILIENFRRCNNRVIEILGKEAQKMESQISKLSKIAKTEAQQRKLSTLEKELIECKKMMGENKKLLSKPVREIMGEQPNVFSKAIKKVTRVRKSRARKN